MLKTALKRNLTRKIINKERTREEDIIMSPLSGSLRSPLSESEKKAVDEKWSKITGGGINYHIKSLKSLSILTAFPPNI